MEDGNASLSVELAPDHLNPLGLVHGGLYATMLDVALAMSGKLSASATRSFARPYDVINVAIFGTSETRKTDLRWLRQGVPVAVSRYFLLKVRCWPRMGAMIATATGVFKPGRKPASQIGLRMTDHPTLTSPANIDVKKEV